MIYLYFEELMRRYRTRLALAESLEQHIEGLLFLRSQLKEDTDLYVEWSAYRLAYENKCKTEDVLTQIKRIRRRVFKLRYFI